LKRPRARCRHTYLAVALTLAGTLGCNALMPPVARRVDGVTSNGRFIEPDAYAMFAVAALHEARGQWGEALALYQRALDMDGRGPELRTRIGAVACKLHRDEVADEAFAAAGRADAAYGPLWFELAQCKKARGDLPFAERAALEAVRLDPERFEASLLAADLAELRGDRALAWQLRDGLATHLPDSPAVQRAIWAAAKRARDPVRAARALAAVTRLDARRGSAAGRVGIARALDALRHADITTAKREAEQLLGADPSNGDALVVALVVADLQQDHATFDALLEGATDAGTPASPEVLSTLAALLSRRVSAQAAQLVQPQP
jgi:tetratricopeptide (TPR) repeat protein